MNWTPKPGSLIALPLQKVWEPKSTRFLALPLRAEDSPKRTMRAAWWVT